MKPVTLGVHVPASRAEVFNYLANVENLPQWAGAFCERLELARGRWLGLTLHGDVFVELEADEHTGVIDLRWGEQDVMERLLPLRVIALPVGGAFVSGVLYPDVAQTVFAFEREREAFARALQSLAERLRTPGTVAWASALCAAG